MLTNSLKLSERPNCFDRNDKVFENFIQKRISREKGNSAFNQKKFTSALITRFLSAAGTSHQRMSRGKGPFAR